VLLRARGLLPCCRPRSRLLRHLRQQLALLLLLVLLPSVPVPLVVLLLRRQLLLHLLG
jgi:hypothetical protein